MEVPEGVELRQNVVYGTGGGRELTLNLYLPEEEAGEPRPGVVFIHGGGWRNGNPSQFHRHSATLAEHGYVCASITYRLSGEAQFPAALEDSKCAVRWMRANAEELGLDVDRLAVGGGSAGGHLAGLVAMTEPGEFEGEGGNPEQSSAAQAYVGFNPVADLAGMGEKRPDHPMLVEFLGVAYTDDPEAYKKASPIAYVSEDSPPTLLLHGTEDVTVPYADAEAMVTALQELGVEAELFTAEGVGHAFFNRDPWFTPCLEKMQEFLDEVL